MRQLGLLLSLLAVASAAMQQVRSPVYTPNLNNNNNQPQQAKTLLNPDNNPKAVNPMNPAMPQAQAREGTAAENVAAPAAPAQNYLVYYVPEAGHNGFRQGAVGTYATEPGFFSRIPWVDVGVVGLSVVMLGFGGYLIYSNVGTNVKARALRELQELTYEDATQMARRVLRAIEKFQNLNTEAE